MNKKNIKLSINALNILLIFLGLILVFVPNISLIVSTKIIGISSVAKGLVMFIMYYKLKRYFSFGINTEIIIGFALVVFGISFIIRPNIFEIVLSYIVSIWFIILAMIGFNFSNMYKNDKSKYILNIILNSLLILGSIIILFNQNSSININPLLIGVLLILDGFRSLLFINTAIYGSIDDKKYKKTTKY